MDILKLAALAVTAALCALVLRKRVPELAVVLVLAAGVLILSQAMEALAGVRGLMDSLARTAGLSPEIWKPVVKTVGIGIVARLAAAVCKDAGEGGVAAFLETAGAALALFTALPLVETVFDTLGALL
ncbi:SpoIIIAC/SpoIIIAD family protein [Pseudoflavonifractor phocaeensis]|uniref:SpoIIIAC/SpoIIIAD family protein n=1 Tax=Pseudoflavonifractor phocaeensis TaxID=1870988 RepID=UPI0030874366|nr:stage III sporulation protein AD [Oscillospiraceae bacterium]